MLLNGVVKDDGSFILKLNTIIKVEK